MAVTTTIDELINDIRIVDVPSERAKAQRLMDFYSLAVVRLAETAPDEAHNMALRQAVGYAFDSPSAAVQTRFSNVMRFSGAASTLQPWRAHGGGLDTEASSAASTGGAPSVVGLEIVGSNIILTYSDSSTESVPLPPSIGGLSVANVERTGDNLTITYSDGTTAVVALPAGGGNLRWPGL